MNSFAFCARFLWVVLGIAGCATGSTSAPSTTASVPVTTVDSVTFSLSTDRCSRGEIVISGTRCSSVGIEAEHQYLAKQYPGSVVVEHALLSSVVGSPCNTVSDAFKIRLPSGELVAVTFETSEFFGRYEGCPQP